MDEKPRRKTNQARQLRNEATPAERALWLHLSARKLSGARFNRQVCIGPYICVCIGPYICDFASRAHRLVIEIDGDPHAAQQEYDRRRTEFLQSQGYRVIRFWNNEVLGNVEGVVAAISDALSDSPSPNPSRKREGE